jgi:GntR family transcriptional regulator
VRRTEVREQLRELIDGRPPGEALPSERALSERLGVSRPTVRAALDDLVAGGLVVRRHGLGTFTSPSPIHQLLPTGGEPVPPADGAWESEVLQFEVSSAGARLGQQLRISPGDDVVRALRRRVVDGQPMALEEIRLPAAVVPRITRSDFESVSLYQRLRDLHGVTPANATQITEPTVTDATESRLLDVPLYSPALQFERTTQDTAGRTIEFTRSVYRGDRYRITSHLTFGPNSG